MERVIILKNTVSGQQLTLPVTPSRYPMGRGRAVEHLDMAQTGQLALPGLKRLFSEPLEVMLPARNYPFCTAGTVADPQYYLDILSAWSDNGDVCRYIVAGGGVNAAVLLGPIEHEERDGSNDVYVTIPLYEYRYLDEVIVEKTQNSSRAVENNNQKATADTYTVVAGDTLWSICKQFYGDGALAYRLAAANGIDNPNLIYDGQILTLPALGELPEATYQQQAPNAEQTEDTGTVVSEVRASLRLDPNKTRVRI